MQPIKNKIVVVLDDLWCSWEPLAECLAKAPNIKLFSYEVVAKLASEVKFNDFFAGSVSRKLTYPIGHRQVARNSNPAKKVNLIQNGVLQLPRKRKVF